MHPLFCVFCINECKYIGNKRSRKQIQILLYYGVKNLIGLMFYSNAKKCITSAVHTIYSQSKTAFNIMQIGIIMHNYNTSYIIF